MSLRVIHLSVARGFPGLVQQLGYEYCAAERSTGVEWTTLAYIYCDNENAFVRKIPRVFQGFFRRKLFAWLWLIRHARKYDYVVMRHMAFDPFALAFSWLVKNRVVVFHSKTDKELPLISPGWRGRMAALMEKIAGYVVLRNAVGVLGVTEDIRKYHVGKLRNGKPTPSSVYPNGILVEQVPAVDDFRSDSVIGIGFMCGSFAKWHGLDLMMDALFDAESINRFDQTLVLHLVGNVNEDQKRAVGRFREMSSKNNIIVHGRLDSEGYRDVFSECHVGLGALAIYRKNADEAASLKVREMLAMGVPVYSGHRDAAIPDDFPYYRVQKGDLLEGLIDFALANRTTERQTVRDRAGPYIDKVARMRAVTDFLSGLKAD